MIKNSKLFVFLLGIIGYFSLINIVYFLRYLLEIIVYKLSDSDMLTAISPVIIYIGSLILLYLFFKKSDYFIGLFEKRIFTFITIFILSFLLNLIFFLLYTSITLPIIIEKNIATQNAFNHEKYSLLFSNIYLYIIKILIVIFVVKEGIMNKRRKKNKKQETI